MAPATASQDRDACVLVVEVTASPVGAGSRLVVRDCGSVPAEAGSALLDGADDCVASLAVIR